MNILKEVAIQIAGMLLFVFVCSLVIIIAFLPLSIACVYRTLYPLLLYILMFVAIMVADKCDRKR